MAVLISFWAFPAGGLTWITVESGPVESGPRWSSFESGPRLPSEKSGQVAAAAMVQSSRSFGASRSAYIGSYGRPARPSRAGTMARDKAPAGAKAAAAATIAAAATWPSFSDGNLGPDSKDDNLGPDSSDNLCTMAC